MGQRIVQLCHHGAHIARNLKRIRGRLSDDADAQTQLPIGPQDRLTIGGAERHGGHVPEPDILFDLHRFKGLRGRDTGGGAHVDRLPVASQITRRRVIGDIGQGALDVAQGQAPAGQFQLINIDAEKRFAVTIDLQIRHPVDRDQPVFDAVLHQFGQLLRRAAHGGHGDTHHRLGVGVGFDDLRLFGALGQLVHDPRHRVAHIGRSHVDIRAVVELKRDPAAPKAGV